MKDAGKLVVTTFAAKWLLGAARTSDRYGVRERDSRKTTKDIGDRSWLAVYSAPRFLGAQNFYLVKSLSQIPFLA
jgi:hypothetical protein